MSGDVAVRQAVRADVELLASLFDAYRQFQGERADLVAARSFLRERLDRDESIVFLAERGGAAAGFAQLYPSFSSVALARVFLLNDLYVDAGARRAGVASRLLAAVEAHARTLGAVRLTLFVARPNTTAQALYASRGWAKDEQFFVYHRRPAA
jgi:GNAT superfamily N-acetyltransferase